MAYLHGAETIEVSGGPQPITQARSAVVGLVGIAPVVSADNPFQILTPEDQAAAGKEVPGFTIPQALTDLFAQGYTVVICVNVFALTMLQTVTDEVHTLLDNGDGNFKYKLINPHVKAGAAMTFKDGSSVAQALVLGTDYTVDDFGNVVVLASNGFGFGLGDTIKTTYKRLNTAAVTDSVIVGGYDEPTDTFSGIAAFDLAQSMWGYSPKLLIAPGHESPTVQSALVVKANKYRAMILQDLDDDTYTVPEAVAERGAGNTTTLFYTSMPRVVCLFPYLKRLDPYTNAQGSRPYAPFFAGVTCAVDNTLGYWYSPSNKQINGTTGPVRSISAALNDPNCQANQLNAAGIVTIFNNFGTGYRTWGNRSAAFPVSTKPENFICVRRTADVIEDSIEMAMMEWVDLPLDKPTIDAIRESVNEFIRTLIGKGAIVDGACTFDPAKNPLTELAAGHVTFSNNFMPPTPGERISFDTFIDISLLKALVSGS